MVIQSGRMNRRVEIWRRAPRRDAVTGEDIGDWAKLSACWAEVVPLAGREYFGPQQRVADADARFNVRFRGDLDVRDRLLYDGQAYDILSIDEVGHREGLSILGRARAET